MDYLHLLLLSIVQGLTEFLPISSSAHLILLPELAGWEDQGLVYDIAAHVGSLIAVLVYFYKDIKKHSMAWIGSLQGGPVTQDARLVWYVIIGTLPVAISGLIFYEIVATAFRNPLIIAGATILFGLLLWWADVEGKRARDQQTLNLKDAVLIGLAQLLALVPGVSRSGITMTAGLMLGFDRHTAARFSFYLAIPVILLAGGYEIYRYFGEGNNTNLVAFMMVVVVSGISAWIAIKFFLALLERTGMLPYAIYRIFLGSILLYLYL